jgi:hypothetical protein
MFLRLFDEFRAHKAIPQMSVTDRARAGLHGSTTADLDRSRRR